MIGWSNGLDEDGKVWEAQACLSNENPDILFMIEQTIPREWVLSPCYMLNMSRYNPGRQNHVMLGNKLSLPTNGFPSQFTLLDKDIGEREKHENATLTQGRSGFLIHAFL
jgi:hypothetical protein